MDLSNFSSDVKRKESNDSEEIKLEEVKDKKLELDFENIKETFKGKDIERYLPWFLKYQLKTFDDLIQTSEIKKILDFIENFKKGNGILLAGSAGSGKTTTLTLIANHFGYEIFELNASDARNKKSIEESVGDAIKQRSLFADKKLILIDEADGVSGTYDRGGLATLSNLVKESPYPVAFTANDKESDKIKAIKKVATFVDFENHSEELLQDIGERILKAEKIKYKKEDLENFVEERSTKDIRGFINDLQACVYDSKFELDTNLEIRDYKKKIDNLLNSIYYSYPEDAVRSQFNSDINLDELFLYLEENTPNVYTKNALIKAFSEISKADVFKGRIMRWQHWRFLVYINFYLTYAVSNSKDEPTKSDKYKKNGRILSKWIYGTKMNGLKARTKTQKVNGDNEKFIEKLTKCYGRSSTRIRSDDIYYFSKIYQNNESFQKEMDERLEIDDSVRKALNEL